MTTRRMFGTIIILLSMATMVCGQDIDTNFYSAADVERNNIYSCSRSLAGIEQINTNLYLACFESGPGVLGERDYSFIAYDAVRNQISNTIEIQGSLSYKIKKIEGRNMFILVTGNEIANSRLVAFNENELVVLQTYFDADLIAAGEDLIGMAFYDPIYAGRTIRGTNSAYSLFPIPGPFGDCEFFSGNSVGGVHYLCKDFAVVYISNNLEQIVRSIKPDCTFSWTIQLPLLSNLVGFGNLDNELIGVLNGGNGSVGLVLRSGALVNLGAEGQWIFAFAFLDQRLIYSLEKPTGAADGVREYQLRNIGMDAASFTNIQLPMARRPLAMCASSGHLICFYNPSKEYPNGMTVVYNSGFSSARILSGCWIVIEDENGDAKVLGGDRGNGNLDIGTVSLFPENEK